MKWEDFSGWHPFIINWSYLKLFNIAYLSDTHQQKIVKAGVFMEMIKRLKVKIFSKL